MSDNHEKDRGASGTIRTVLAVLVAIPTMICIAGYFMWVGPSLRNYGINVAPHLSLGALIEPGAAYLFILVLGTLVSFIVGLEALWRPLKIMPRKYQLIVEIVIWVIVLQILVSTGKSLASGQWCDYTEKDWAERSYPYLHILVLSQGIRRLRGLIRGVLLPQKDDNRERTRSIRILQGILVVLLVALQLNLAVLYGILGVNPAKMTRPVEIVLSRPLSSSYDTLQLNMIDLTRDHMVGYDDKLSCIRIIPREQIEEILLKKRPAAPN